MAEEQKPSLHIDTDWKKQAQEEKRRLAEQEAQRAATPAGPAGVVGSAGAAVAQKAAPGRGAGTREPGGIPPASLATLVQGIVTQALFYMGELATRGGEPIVNLDMAKHHVDTLALIEDKMRNNLTEDEKPMLDAALYEVRMRFINIASQYAQLP
jgi:hypothetical protein